MLASRQFPIRYCRTQSRGFRLHQSFVLLCTPKDRQHDGTKLGTLDWEIIERRPRTGPLHQLVEVGVAQTWAHEQFPPQENSVLTFAYNYETAEQQARRGFKPDADTDPMAAWTRLQAINRKLGHPLLEGLVAKRADSIYPRQRRSPDIEFPYWVKYRWPF